MRERERTHKARERGDYKAREMEKLYGWGERESIQRGWEKPVRLGRGAKREPIRLGREGAYKAKKRN